MIDIQCISLQSKRKVRFAKIKKFYPNEINLIEEKAIEGQNKALINQLKTKMNITFDNKASYGNQALLIKSVLLWQDFYKYSDKKYIIIIEDDVIPCANFISKFNIVYSELPLDYDICLLTGVISLIKKTNIYDYSDHLYNKIPFSHIGGYILSKKGAAKLIELATTNIIKTHQSGGVLDSWISSLDIKFYKSKKNLFIDLNIPSSLANSRNKFMESIFPNFIFNQCLFTYKLASLGINGKITLTYNLILNYIVIKFINTFLNNKIKSILIVNSISIIDIYLHNYLLEEKSNKILEVWISSILFKLK